MPSSKPAANDKRTKATPVARPPKKAVGRTTKLTPDIQERIVEVLSTGGYLMDAARYVGINPATIHAWIDRGKKEEARQFAFPDDAPDPVEEQFREFLNAVEKAKAAARLRAVGLINRAAADGTWQAAAWFLERTAPKEWGRRSEVELTGAEGGAVRVDVNVAELEKKILKVMEKRGIGQS